MEERIPDLARQVLRLLVRQLEMQELQIAKIEKPVLSLQRNNAVSRRLATIPSVGPIIATAIAATVVDPSEYRSGREFAAGLGLKPKQHSTSGKAWLGGISKRV